MTKPRILITRHWPESVLARLRERYELSMSAVDVPLSQDALHEAMTRFDALCPTVTDRLPASLFDVEGRTVRIIANYGAGFEHIDLAAARRAGIVVTNTPDVLTDATAQLALLLMLMVSRRAGEGERQLRSGCWPGWHPMHLIGPGLQGRHLGLLGFGRIGQATARLARSVTGMSISYHSRRPVELPADLAGLRYQPSLEALLAESDVVSLHCPGGEQTRNLINAERLALMTSDAILINTARGSVVDEAALAEALAAGRLGGAGLDVYACEPQITPALLALENVVLLPHLGSATVETRTQMGLRALANLDAFFAGQEIPDRVA